MIVDAEEVKKRFLEIFKLIKRKGNVRLLKWLLNSDFFTAPASTKYHLATEGGLALHSINVYERLKSIVMAEHGADYQKHVSDETIAVCGLLHDVCKVNFYALEMRNVKEGGGWVQKPFYKVDEALPYGHGEKSVYIVNAFIRLTRAEAMAINWHMGGFDERISANSMRLGEAYKQFPLAVMLHGADLFATYLSENTALSEKNLLPLNKSD